VFVLKALPHATFERSGNDLLTHATITLSEALLGFSRILLKHLDGRGIKISSPPRKIIKPETCIIVRGEGMPIYKSHGQKGDLYVIISVEMPDEAWLRRVDRQVKSDRLDAAVIYWVHTILIQALASLLPPKKPEPEPYPVTVDEAPYEESDIVDVRSRSFTASADFFDQDFRSQFGGDDEDDWEDEDEDEHDEFGMGAEPECRPQ
jgi:DnaJ family protein A protein 2